MKATTNSYRFWNPRRVVDNLERLVRRYGVRHIKFADEMFVLNRRHIEEICDGIIEKNLDLNIWAYARVDTVKPDTLSSSVPSVSATFSSDRTNFPTPSKDGT